MASYRLSLAAEDDLARLYRRGITEFGLAQADRYFDGLIARFDRIAGDPSLYAAVDHIRPGYRRSVYGTHSVYYRIEGRGVEIMRVLGREDVMALVE
ncbi:MAG TPA: type II toxin-antitoxin system RelE/ParE family toxin [Rhodospirillaceae bacterium]|nr:type II toxin-antitoxin system RelE/ParE family toxin [Rhodospirillaceae bacterium]